MSKQVFWPLTAIVLGLIFLASNMNMLPREFWNLWPMIAIIVGLGGLVVSDRSEWMVDLSKKKSAAPKTATKSKAKSKSRRK